MKTATTNDKRPVVCVQTENIALFYTYLRLCFPILRSKYFCFFFYVFVVVLLSRGRYK